MKRKRLMRLCLSVAVLFFSLDALAVPVPDTGQTKCYDVAGNVITCPSTGQALYGQDANYTINPMPYTKLDGSGNALSSFRHLLAHGAGQCDRADLGGEKQHGWANGLQQPT